MTEVEWISFAIVVLCLLLSAFFSGSETALTASSRASMARLEKHGNKRASLVNRMLRTRERLLGALLALALHVWRSGRPHIAILGRLPGTQHFRNVARYSGETWPNLLLLRIDESIYFANAGRIEQFVLETLAARPTVTDLVLVGSGINHIDSSGLAMLETLLPGLREAGVRTHLAEFKGPVLDRLRRSRRFDLLAPGEVFLTTNEAATTLAADVAAAPTEETVP